MNALRFFHLAALGLVIAGLLLALEVSQLLREFSWGSVLEITGILFVASGFVLVLLKPAYRSKRVTEVGYLDRRIAAVVVVVLAAAMGALAALLRS